MKVERNAECSPWSILHYIWPAFNDNWSWKPIFGLFESGRFRQVLLQYYTDIINGTPLTWQILPTSWKNAEQKKTAMEAWSFDQPLFNNGL